MNISSKVWWRTCRKELVREQKVSVVCDAGGQASNKDIESKIMERIELLGVDAQWEDDRISEVCFG